MNATEYTLFTDVSKAYRNMITALQQATHNIHMIYFAFDHGEWAGKISRVLIRKAANGVQVKLMVDELGMVVDNVKNSWRNRVFLAELKAAGIKVDIFADDVLIQFIYNLTCFTGGNMPRTVILHNGSAVRDL